MLQIRFWQALMGVSLAILASGCANNPGPPPVISLAGRDCVAQPDFKSVQPVPMGNRDGKTVKFDGKAPCLQSADGTRGVYALFRLPQSAEPYVVSVNSRPLAGGALIAPHVLLLGLDRKIVRELPRDAFVFRGVSLYDSFRVHSGEEYLLVVSDSRSVGQDVSKIVEGVQTTTVYSGYAAYNFTTGSEEVAHYIYAYNGSITVTARPLPKPE